MTSDVLPDYEALLLAANGRGESLSSVLLGTVPWLVAQKRERGEVEASDLADPVFNAAVIELISAHPGEFHELVGSLAETVRTLDQ